MNNAHKDAQLPYHEVHRVPIAENVQEIEIEDADSTEDQAVDVDVYEEREFFMDIEESKSNSREKRYSHMRRRNERMERVMDNISAEKVDVIELGTSVILGTCDRTLSRSSVEKSIRTGISEATFLGDISIEAIVEGTMTQSEPDIRYAMLGTSVMWNALKTNMRDLKSWIVDQTAQTYTESRFDSIDLKIDNLPNYEKSYEVRAVGVFLNADLHHVFSMLTFRKSAKLLNKTKQFLKAYFIVACRPRCMIWRYTLRRSGNSQKKVILNLPFNIVKAIIDFLLDLTGIGNADIPYEELDVTTPFYHSLGEDEDIREQRYYEYCKLKDPLATFFRNAITDCLNEIREMPFSIKSGTIISPLRGRNQDNSCIMWKDYEGYLRKEYDEPSEENMKRRRRFEQLLCDNQT